MPGQKLPLQQWSTFFVIISAAAATLLGLLFVLITLAAQRGRKDAASIRLYLTPTVIFFGSSLLMSTFLTIPTLTPLAAALGICLEGIAGLSYCISLAIRRGADSAFYEQRSELFPYVVFPFAAHALMLAGGLLLRRNFQTGLDLAAAAMLALLGIAIRNSWAIAVTIVSSQN